MCGRYGGPKELEVYAGFLPVAAPFEDITLQPEYSIGQKAPVFAKNRDGQVVAQSMRLGLIPNSWSQPIKAWRYSTHNARLETIATNQSFARSWANGWRCVVPAAWIGETLHVVDVPSGRLPAEFYRRDGRPMGLAGVWDFAKTHDGPVLSFALITRAPGPKMFEVHPREVCVIDPELWAPYLDGETVDLSTPWESESWGLRLPERSRKKVAESPQDMFTPQSSVA